MSRHPLPTRLLLGAGFIAWATITVTFAASAGLVVIASDRWLR